MLNGRFAMCMSAGMVVGIAGSAAATQITWYFSGELTHVGNYGGVPDDVVVGMPFSGSFTYEPPIPDSLPDNEFQAIYHVGAGALRVQIGNYQIISAEQNFMSVISWSHNDEVGLIALDLDTPFGFATEWRLQFFDADSDILSSTDLPLTPPSLEPLEVKRLSGEGAGFVIEGIVQQLVPEPATLVLILVSTPWLVLRRSRRCSGR